MEGKCLGFDRIPYDLVSTRLNFWYTAIKNNLITEAKEIKKEVEQLIDNMEENQDVLMYYQLLDFRHELMLSYMRSEDLKEVNETYEQLRQFDGNLTGMLEYYFFFFMGMYEFRQRELTTAISAYRIAETKLNGIEDEIEHAEFYFKISEVYYYMKQTFFSLNYAKRALRIYSKYNSYADHIIHVQCIMAGNLMDILDYEGALNQFRENLNIARKLNKSHLVGTSHLNLGICCIARENYEEAEKHLMCSIKIFEEDNHSFLPKALFNMAHALCKNERSRDAKLYLEKGVFLAKMNNDLEYINKFNILKSLYVKEEKYLLDQCFVFFKERQMFADIEDFALEVAEYYREKKRYELASEYYHIVNIARKEIKKGEIIYENQNDFIGNDHDSSGLYISGVGGSK
ncbi:response regulator aspartate phosphatase [Bacillus altitudinis]|uniref:response regulator aspartate phosphatase n=1 Tax=Bacillus altitudinis TaxID=293387 RepID=UPI004058C4AA